MMMDFGKDAGAGRTLPAAFVEEMKELFKTLPGVSVSELPAFLESLAAERSYGLRRNPLKYTKEEFEEKMPYALEKISWAGEGYFYRKEEQPGRSPYHEAGAFYIQEPSAMIAVELLGAGPGEYIADLCAAPGGKSTQIAGRMQGEGILVCNEYVPARAEILAQNMERMGILNCVVLKESVDHMAERFPLFFDRVLVDAPCSGSGMFRKEEEALLQWSPENVRMCAERQTEILEHTARMVRPGGALVYSTCSFSEAEDEGVIERFLQEHKEFALDEASLTEELLAAGICPGRLPGTVRMWPHKLRGEGHFAARLVKAGEGVLGRDEKQQAGCAKSITSKVKNAQKENQNYFQDFCQQYLTESCFEKLEAEGNFVWKKEFLFFMPALLPDLGSLRIQRSGLYLGEAKKGRFEPSHTWAMTLKKEDVRQWVEVKNPAAYLRGETADNEAGLKGWALMLLQGKPLGWGKAGGSMVKNHYPKGLRKNLKDCGCGRAL